jgi:ketosteroid isomerase-like protein
MSEENVEVVRKAYEAWGKGDPGPVLDALDEEMEWDWTSYPLPDVAERGKGRDNYLRFVADFSASWAKHEITVTDIVDSDEHVVVPIHERMQASGGDLLLERDIAHVCTMRDGRIALVRAYRTKAEALEAAGLRK